MKKSRISFIFHKLCNQVKNVYFYHNYMFLNRNTKITFHFEEKFNKN